MNKFIDHKFVNMCKQGIMGAFLGIIAGAILGLVIYWIQFPIMWLTDPGSFNDMDAYRRTIWQTVAQPSSLGSAAGAIIGGIFGALYGLKKNTK